MAKLKQIAIEPATVDAPGMIWGLCRDGSLWMRDLNGGHNVAWLRVAVPEGKPAMPARRQRAAAAQVELPGMRVSGGESD